MKRTNHIRIIHIFFKYAGVEERIQSKNEVIHKETGTEGTAYDA